MDCIVCGVAKSWTRLNDFHFDNLDNVHLAGPREPLQVEIIGMEVFSGITYRLSAVQPKAV